MSCCFGMGVYAVYIPSHAIETERKLFVALRVVSKDGVSEE